MVVSKDISKSREASNATTPTNNNSFGPYEAESVIILRLPLDYASTLQSFLSLDSSPQEILLKDNFKIELDVDSKKAKVHFFDHNMRAKLKNLPCIVEVQKSLDKKVFHKSADISQILICKDINAMMSTSSEEEEQFDSGKRERHYNSRSSNFNHGITPCLKNVRKRRFRKMSRKRNIDLPDIEKEIKRLLKSDVEAVNVKWQIIGGECSDSTLITEVNDEDEKKDFVDEQDIFGEALTSSEDSDEKNSIKDEITDSKNLESGSKFELDFSQTDVKDFAEIVDNTELIVKNEEDDLA